MCCVVPGIETRVSFKKSLLPTRCRLTPLKAEQVGERKITPEGTLQMLLAGMGILNTMPMLATIMLEKGLNNALKTVGQVFISGGPLYFMFHIQTRAHFFYQVYYD